MTAFLEIRGLHGQYGFLVEEIGKPATAGPAIYLYLKPHRFTQWELLFVGQTDDLETMLADRLTDPGFIAAARLGATHFAYMAASEEERERSIIERDIVVCRTPPCNFEVEPDRFSHEDGMIRVAPLPPGDGT